MLTKHVRKKYNMYKIKKVKSKNIFQEIRKKKSK